MDQRLYTVEEAAGFLKIHPKTLRRKIREGEIESTRVGKRYRFTEAQLQAYLGGAVPLSSPAQPLVQRRTIASAVIDVAVVSPEQHTQISNYLTAALANARQSEAAIKTSVHCSYSPETAELKVMLSGDIAVVQALMHMLETLLVDRKEEN